MKILDVRSLVAWAAAGWSALYGVMAAVWWGGGGEFPFAPVADDRSSASILEGTPAAVVAPVMVLVCALATAVAVYLAAGGPGRAAIWFGWGLAAVLALLLPDYSLLAFVAFAPVLVVFAFTGVPGPQDGVGDIMYWHRTNLLILFAGGLLWAAAALLAGRHARGVCVRCGGSARPEGDLRRWGRRAVLVAVLAPIPYEVTRLAWYFGVPLGVPAGFLAEMRATPGMLEVGLGCAVLSIGGGVLTHGLVSSWGERYPRWLFWKAGRRVPPMLAVVPAMVVAVVLIPAGLMNLRLPVTAATWGLTAPGILWIVWGVALGAAAVTYHLRRRPPCRHCLRPEPAPRSVAAGGAASGT
ncbi:NYN domain-containing protein [Dactylosporangium sp. NPDC051541]|uniref:NYN domain-containing protein n=1 Tax=Dactylosporangium sp. NPDC051541 TaxID=3363977 RepID=UPI00378FD011